MIQGEWCVQVTIVNSHEEAVTSERREDFVALKEMTIHGST